MRGVVFDRFGEPANVLQVRNLEAPAPKSGEVRVRMLSSPINPSDLMTVRGVYGKLPELPATPGFEGVGIVESSEAGLLGKYFIGKRVVVLNRSSGNWCEQTVVPARQVIPVAADIPLEQAAMFFVNPASAYVMTRSILRVRPGEWLLQTAAGSAVGRMVIRLGKQFGFRTLGIVRRPEQIDELKSLGSDEILAFDPQADDPQSLRDQVRQLTGGRGAIYAIDPVGGETGSAAVSCLADGGHMLVYGTLADEPLRFSSRTLMTVGSSIQGFWLARWILAQGLVTRLKLIRRISQLIRAGVLSSEVGQTFPLEQIGEAVRAAEQTGRAGKVLLRITE